ncbi:MAG: VCBS repeat-containing protein [Gemmatimonadetes bacterium]|nr:VCBS repeat-containing protein [Gemmatimonadota bacterium]
MANLRLVLPLVAIALVVSACGAEPRSAMTMAANADSAALAALRVRYPTFKLEPRDTSASLPPWERVNLPHAVGGTGRGTGYRAGVFGFTAPGAEWPYGSVVAVWDAKGGLVWTHDRGGDFPPHPLTWLDVDSDGDTDLFFTAGHENVLETNLFLNEAGRRSRDSAFVLVYQDSSNYTALLDLDSDGTPELIDSGRSGGDEYDEEGPCADYPLPPAVLDSAGREYARYAGTFDRANVKFFAEGFAPWTLHLLDPVRILQVRNGRIHDATREFPGHLRWRLRMLEAYSETVDEACRAYLEPAVADLRRSTS